MRVVALCATLVAVGMLCRPQVAFAQESQHFLLFSGADLWGNGGFAHGGLVWSPDGIDREGFAAKFMMGAGQYRYLSGGIRTTGTFELADALPGWRFKRGTFELALFLGVELQSHHLSPDDFGNRVRGAHVGVRTGADLWWEPTAATMVSASASWGSVGTSYWTRAAFGWRVFGAFYLGPEVHAMGDGKYEQWRAGLHATAFKAAGFEWSAGAGFVEDSDHRSGLYGRIGLLTRQ
jgi:hypothetical protein